MAAACSSPVSEGGSGGAGIECSPLYLSRLLGTERQDQAASLSRVCLPGLRQTSHSGYITVDHRHDSHLFFWFFPATKVAPDETQLIVYLNGGPGNSAMIGLFEEIGPITVDKNGELVERVTSWVDHYSVIFVDNPIGVGFSYSGGGGESKRNCDIANNLYSFLTQFLQLFPLYQKCDLYIGGVSYAGKYVAGLAHKMHEVKVTQEETVPLRLAGVFIGSGLCEPVRMMPLYPDFLVSLGLLTDRKGREVRERIEYAIDKHKHLGKPEEAVTDILEYMFSNMQTRLGYRVLDNALCAKEYDWQFESFLNRPEVQKAVHVRPGKYAMFAPKMLRKMAADFLSGVGDELSVLLDHYKVLIYTGNMDLIVSVPMTEAFLTHLPWSGKDDYLTAEKQTWRGEGGDVAGYVTRVGNLTRVVLRNAGHRAAIDQPVWTREMLGHFIRNTSFGHPDNSQLACSDG